MDCTLSVSQMEASIFISACQLISPNLFGNNSSLASCYCFKVEMFIISFPYRYMYFPELIISMCLFVLLTMYHICIDHYGN